MHPAAADGPKRLSVGHILDEELGSPLQVIALAVVGRRGLSLGRAHCALRCHLSPLGQCHRTPPQGTSAAVTAPFALSSDARRPAGRPGCSSENAPVPTTPEPVLGRTGLSAELAWADRSEWAQSQASLPRLA
jgi:hypothetical protein